MVDIALKQDETTAFDVLIDGPDLLADRGFRTAIIISLFTDRLVTSDEIIPDGTNNKRGWWADTFADVDGDLIGSRLWLLNREKQIDQVLNTAKEYAFESLQWMINDGVVSQIEVETEWVQKGVLGILVRLFKADSKPFEQTFEYSLNGLLTAELSLSTPTSSGSEQLPPPLIG